MTQEYIIVSKTAIEERINQLKPTLLFTNRHEGEIKALENILSQSTPLIPEIEKAFEAGEKYWLYSEQVSLRGNKQDYISNLKLDI